MRLATAKLWCLKIVLGPVLLLQGWWVRRKTPILPEPVSEKSGQMGSGTELRLLVIGDSSAAGVGAPDAEASLLGQLLKQLSPSHHVTFCLLAETGKTTQDVLLDLSQHTSAKFDLVITALGVNDVTAQVPLARWQQQQMDLIELIKAKFRPQQLIMSGLPPVADFPALVWPLNAYMGRYADHLDEILQGLVANHEQVHFLSLRGYPDEAQAATDGFHPGPVVYQMWAEQIVAMIKQTIR